MVLQHDAVHAIGHLLRGVPEVVGKEKAGGSSPPVGSIPFNTRRPMTRWSGGFRHPTGTITHKKVEGQDTLGHSCVKTKRIRE